MFSHILFFFFFRNCNQNNLWEKGHCCVNHDCVSPHKGKGMCLLDKGFQGFADFTTFCRNTGLYVHTGEKPTTNPEKKVNQFKWNRGVTVMSINIKSHQVSFSQAVKGMMFWGSVNSTVVLTGASWVCLQGLLLPTSQAVWRTASTQIAPAGWISQSLMAFLEVAVTYSALLGIMLPSKSTLTSLESSKRLPDWTIFNGRKKRHIFQAEELCRTLVNAVTP